MAEWDKKQPRKESPRDRRDLDDFWDVESLLPQRPARRTPPPPRPAPTAVDIELTPGTPPSAAAAAEPVSAAPLTFSSLPKEAGEGSTEPPQPAKTAETAGVAETAHATDTAKTALPDYSRPVPQPQPQPRPRPAPSPDAPPPKAAEAEPLLEYQPDGVLLHRVRVYGWQANYHYFDQFTKDAVRYAAMKPPAEARMEPFFSYFPQYVQLSRRATAWYLYWREHVRQGRYPDTDYAYVLLYLFELINLPADDAATARAHRDLLAHTWMAYRRSHPQLDHYMCEWLCDYCLIHALDAPIDLLAPALDDIILDSRLKEFYLSAAVRLPSDTGTADTALETARILMRHCCQYDYRKSKFAQGEHKTLFDKTIPAAVASVLPLLLGSGGQKPAITMLDSILTRDAYTGALCSYQNKRRIEVSYTSFSRSHELRFLIGDMVKHVENRLRSWIGVRSRLSVMSLPIPLRDALDAYLNPLAPPKASVPVKKKEEPRPAYEALYDLPAKAVTTEDAAAIEAASWETTRILVEAFEESMEPEAAPVSAPVTPAPADEPPLVSTIPVPPASAQPDEPRPPAVLAERMPSALTPFVPFIRSALAADPAAQRAAARALSKMPDAIADEINDLTAEGEIGDIILEDDGTGLYTVIEDYRDAVDDMLQ